MTNEAILVFLIGLAAGSFLNVVVYRINDLRSILTGRSHCTHCSHQLAWYDLVPLISFVLLKARCRYCQKPISWQYPIVELGVACMLLAMYLFFGLTWQLLYYGVIFLILAVVFIHDFTTQLVPEDFVWAALVLSLAGGWYFGGFGFSKAFLGAAIGAGLPAILVIVSKERWMGSGDIKIGGVLGALLGFPAVFFGLFCAFLLGSIVGLLAIVLKRKTLKDSLPFAPFIIVATLLGLFFGQQIIYWYLDILYYYN